MRIALLFAASVLVAGCSQLSGRQPRATQLTPITPVAQPPDAATTTAPTTTHEPPPRRRPRAGARGAGRRRRSAGSRPPRRSMAPTSGWRCAAAPPPRSVTTSRSPPPSGISCMTDTRHGSAALACLVRPDRSAPAARRCLRRMEGRLGGFRRRQRAGGIGPRRPRPVQSPARVSPLPADRSLSFGDFRCRTDATVLVCVNYARQTAVSATATPASTPIGCTRQSRPAGRHRSAVHLLRPEPVSQRQPSAALAARINSSHSSRNLLRRRTLLDRGRDVLGRAAHLIDPVGQFGGLLGATAPPHRRAPRCP